MSLIEFKNNTDIF